MNSGGWVAMLAGAGIALYLMADESGLKVELQQQAEPLPTEESLQQQAPMVELESVPVSLPAPPPFTPLQSAAPKPVVEQQPLQFKPLKVEEPMQDFEIEPVKVEPVKAQHEDEQAEQAQIELESIDESVTERQQQQQEQSDGRIKLKAMELGKGPQIRINWPRNLREQQRLQQWMKRCAGMKVALINEDGDLFIAEGTPGRRWELNLDRYSGFVRELGRGTGLVEQQQVSSIRRHHGGAVAEAMPVAIFSRAVDAQLLGGVGRIVGERYMDAKWIEAQYQITGSVPEVAAFRVDGVELTGEIKLRVNQKKGCR